MQNQDQALATEITQVSRRPRSDMRSEAPAWVEVDLDVEIDEIDVEIADRAILRAQIARWHAVLESTVITAETVCDYDAHGCAR